MFIKKIHLLFIIIFLCILSIQAQETGKNQISIIKPGEKAPNNYLFAKDSAANYVGIWDPSRGYGKKKGVIGIKSEIPGKYGAWEVRPTPKCDPGKEYIIEAMVWHTKLKKTKSLCVEVYAFTAAGKPTLLLHGLYKDLPQQWYKIRKKFKVPDNATRIRARFDLTTPGEAYFDKISVKENNINAISKTAAGKTKAGYTQGSSGGLTEECNLTIENGKQAPNGYVFHTAGPQYTGIWDTTRGYGSNKGVIGIKSSKPGKFASWEVFPSPKCEPGKEYIVDAMVWHTKPVKSLGIEVYAFTADNKPILLSHGLYKKLPCQWYRMKKKFKAPENAVRLRVRFDLTTPGEVYFDDIHVNPVKIGKEKYTTAPPDMKLQIPATGWQDLSCDIKGHRMPHLLTVVDNNKRFTNAKETSSVEKTPDGITFKLVGEAGKEREMLWSYPLPQPFALNAGRYLVLRYKGKGIARVMPGTPLLELTGHNANGEREVIDLVNSSQVINDNRVHTLVRKLENPANIDKLKARVITEHDNASFTVGELLFVDKLPDELNPAVKPLSVINDKRFTTLDISSEYNNSLENIFNSNLKEYGLVIDGLQNFPSGQVQVSGAPFKVKLAAPNIISPKENTAVREKKIDCLGKKVPNKYFFPVSRVDAIGIPVNAKASEVLLLLTLSAPSIQKRFALSHRPLILDDIENIAIETIYSSGKRELAFPYSLADKGCYIPNRMLGAYVIATDSTEPIREIVVHNNMFGINFGVAAITLNTGEPLVPELKNFTKPTPAARHQKPAPRNKYITNVDSTLTLGNRYYEYKFNLKNGFSLTGIIDRRQANAKAIKLDPTSGLSIKIDGITYTGRCFKVDKVQTGPDNVVLSLVPMNDNAPQLQLKLSMKLDDSPSLAFNLEAVNTGDKEISPAVSFPVFNNLTIGDNDNTWLFFPENSHVDSAQNMSLQAFYGLEFQFQFMDIYNPKLGSGIMTMADNKELAMMKFVMKKDNDGISSKITFPDEYNLLKPGQKKSFPKICAVLHDGDWHQAFSLYRKYLASCYKPVKSQDKDFFLNAVDTKAYLPGKYLSEKITHTPPVMREDKTGFRWDEVFAIEKQKLGHIPDITLIFTWFYDNVKKRNRYGCYTSKQAYSEVGGLPLFRQTIREIQNKYKRPVALYTIYNSFHTYALPEDAGFSRDDAMRNINGTAIASSNHIFVCPSSKKWQAHVVKDLVKLQKDTGANIVYLDVFSSFKTKKCYGKDHGHSVPSNPLVTDRELITQLRQALPGDVAIYTEYPLPDLTSCYADGSINYYFIELTDHFARPYNVSDKKNICSEMPFNLTRYLTPGYRQFLLPVGIEGSRKPSQINTTLFDGTGFYESTWRLHESRIQKKINHSYQIRKKYNDCFRTKNPEPRVLTEAGGIIANCFSAKNRTLWTVYNSRPNTYSGPVLSIEHVPGAKYIDAWNDRILVPQIKNGKAEISLTLNPQQVGCIVQERSK